MFHDDAARLSQREKVSYILDMTTPCTESNDESPKSAEKRPRFTKKSVPPTTRLSCDRVSGHDLRPVPPGARRPERTSVMSADPAQTLVGATSRSTSATIPPIILRYLTAVTDEAGADLRPAL